MGWKDAHTGNYAEHIVDEINKYAYFHRNDIKYYFGAGKGSENFIFEMGRGNTPQEAIKNYNKKL